MRAVELAKVAAAAEALRLRRLVHRQGVRAGLGVGALVFASAVFVLLQVLVYDLLLQAVHRPWLASLILLAINLVIAGVLGSMAMRNQPDKIEREALAVRRQSLTEARRAVTMMAVAGELTAVALRRGVARSATTARAGRFWALADIAARLARRG